jgi:hypothetical protein
MTETTVAATFRRSLARTVNANAMAGLSGTRMVYRSFRAYDDDCKKKGYQ